MWHKHKLPTVFYIEGFSFQIIVIASFTLLDNYRLLVLISVFSANFKLVLSNFETKFLQMLKELMKKLNYTNEDQKSETTVYSYQVMEKILLCFENETFNINIDMYIWMRSV